MLPKNAQNKQNRVTRRLIAFVVFLLVVVISVKSHELRQKKAEYQEREAELTEEIAYEENRAITIAEFETYTKTKAYVEEVARDKLGLVYEGEILFRDENKSK